MANVNSAADLVGRKVRIADGRFGVVEAAGHHMVGGWRGRSSTSVRLMLTVRVGGETFELSANHVELV